MGRPKIVHTTFLFINYFSDMFRPQFLVSETGFRDYFIWRKIKRRCLDTTNYFFINLIPFYIV